MDDKDLKNNSTVENSIEEEKELLENVTNDHASCEEEIQKLRDSNTRLLAELVNTRKNFDLDKSKSKQSLLLKIISIVDTYSIIANNDNSENTELTTLKNIIQELETLLATEGIKKIEINVGEKFDPNNAEVISTVNGEEDGNIIGVINPAYSLNGQIIKTAKVIVSKKS